MISVNRTLHIKIAFLLWLAVGIGLLVAGLGFICKESTIRQGIGLGIALVIGIVKGGIVLPKIAKQNMLRIAQLPPASPFYATFSLKSWGLIGLMIILGRTLRFLKTPPFYMGTLYMAVGIALILGSRAYRSRKKPAGIGQA